MSYSSSSWEEVRQRRMKMQKKEIHNSTPVEGSRKPYITSESSINTNSPSNISRRLPTRSAKAEKTQKPAGAKKGKKPAEKKTKARINRKKRKPKKLVCSDSDWLTTEEYTDNEKENLKQSVRSPTKGPALFEDIASPELVRKSQAPINDYHFDPPVRQRRKDALSPVKVDLGDGEQTLPVKDLPCLRTVFDSSDEEEELLPKRSDPVRTYPSVAHRRKRKAEINIDKSKRWIIDVKIHTTAADMLWDEYVREHPEEMQEYIAPPAKRQKAKFFVSKSEDSNKSDKGKATKKEDWRTKKIAMGPYDPKHKYIVRGHCDIISRKVVRKNIVTDQFEFPGPKDAEEENLTYSEYKRITENVKNTKSKAKEKLQKSKSVKSASSTEFQRHNDLCSHATRKYIADPYEFPEPKDAEVEICSTGDSDSHRAGPSCSKNERITKKNVKNTKSKEKEKLQKSKSVESASSTEFQRHNDLCSHATRKYIADPYEFPEPKDAEVEICSIGDSDSHRAGPSCSKNERITKKNVKNTKIKEEEKLERSKPVESASSKELRRYSDLCSYATRKYIVDPNEFPEPKDAELEICSTRDSDLHRAGPSCSKNERITKKNVKNTKIKEKEKLQKSKSVESASSTEFQRHNDLCSHATRKYIADPYEFPEPKDAEVEICSIGDSDSHRAGPSCSKNERITKKNVKNTKIKEEEKLERSKPVERASSKELRRYSDLCSYATRLKAKKLEMLFENATKNLNEKSLVSAQRITRKRASELNEGDSKMAGTSMKSMPTIRSVRDLDGKRYVKEKDNWRII